MQKSNIRLTNTNTIYVKEITTDENCLEYLL